MKFEDFKSEIKKINDRFSIERYDEDQIAMIGTTLQDRKAGSAKPVSAKQTAVG